VNPGVSLRRERGDRFRFAFLQEPPFCVRGPDGEISGCDVELARIVLARIGIEQVQLIEAEFSQLLPGLVDGRWEMTTGLFISEERSKLASFSHPIWALHDGLLMLAGHSSGVTGYRSLASRELGLLGVVEGQIQRFTALRSGFPDRRIRVFRTQEEAAVAVANGSIDAYASVAMAHRGYAAIHRSVGFAVVDIPIDEQPPAHGGFALARKNQALCEAIDRELHSFLGSAEHRDLMLRYGFSSAEVDRVVAPGAK
jgi:polar amino acid transport system substrate-binding protein